MLNVWRNKREFSPFANKKLFFFYTNSEHQLAKGPLFSNPRCYAGVRTYVSFGNDENEIEQGKR